LQLGIFGGRSTRYRLSIEIDKGGPFWPNAHS
jgi:hypothetical protein